MSVCLLSLTLRLFSLLFLTYLLFLLPFRMFFIFFSFMCIHLPWTFLDALCHYFFVCAATGNEVCSSFTIFHMWSLLCVCVGGGGGRGLLGGYELPPSAAIQLFKAGHGPLSQFLRFLSSCILLTGYVASASLLRSGYVLICTPSFLQICRGDFIVIFFSAHYFIFVSSFF